MIVNMLKVSFSNILIMVNKQFRLVPLLLWMGSDTLIRKCVVKAGNRNVPRVHGREDKWPIEVTHSKFTAIHI